MARELSLANKCQILFGAATVLIVAAALAGPWIRLDRIVNEAQREIVHELARYAASPYENHANLSIFTQPPSQMLTRPGEDRPQAVIRVAAALRSDFPEIEEGNSFAAKANARTGISGAARQAAAPVVLETDATSLLLGIAEC